MSNIKIPVSLDYGAKEYIWDSGFSSVNEIIEWWLSVDNLEELEKEIDKMESCMLVCNDSLRNQFYNLAAQGNPVINLIDGNKKLSNLILVERRIIFQNGTEKVNALCASSNGKEWGG